MKMLENSEGGRKPLTKLQEDVLNCFKKGPKKQTEVAEELGILQGIVNNAIKGIKKKGYWDEKYAYRPNYTSRTQSKTPPQLKFLK